MINYIIFQKLIKKKLKITLIFSIFLVIFSIKIYAENLPKVPKNEPVSTYLKQAEKIYERMSLDEKLGQLLLPSYRLLATSVTQPAGKTPGYLCKQALTTNTNQQTIIKNCGLDQIAKYQLGAVLQDGGPNYNYPSLNNWQKFNALAMKVHTQLKNDPLLLIGNDAIHGNSHVAGAVIFPHNINLGVAHDPELIKTIGTLTAEDSLHSGFNWVYIPTVAIAQDLRWGRTYESFSQDPQLVKTYAYAYISGIQQMQTGKIIGALATVKHFIGDGATQYGLDEGDAIFTGSEKEFWQQNGSGYEGALKANVLSFMTSYSAINHQRMHFGGEWNIVNRFKEKYQFSGFNVSDYNGPTRAAYFYNQENPSHPLSTLAEIFAKSINAGVDMIMLGNGATVNPFTSDPFYYMNVADAKNALLSAYKQGLISDARLKDAVTHIIAVKLRMQSHVKIPYATLQAKERGIALKAAQTSLVLLKNDNQLLPINKNKIKNIIFIGETNDLGIQNGGWTINWQGQKGNQYFTGKDKITSGSQTLEEAILKKLNKKINIFYTKNILISSPTFSSQDTIAIAVVAEPPYAEYMGDIGNSQEADKFYDHGAENGENAYMPKVQSQTLMLQWNPQETQAIKMLRDQHIPIITVVYSGRPIILSEGGLSAPLPTSDVVIAAFLPGSLGGTALANAIFGDYRFGEKAKEFSNRLTFPWPKNMKDVETHFSTGALFPAGYGLLTTPPPSQ